MPKDPNDLIWLVEQVFRWLAVYHWFIWGAMLLLGLLLVVGYRFERSCIQEFHPVRAKKRWKENPYTAEMNDWARKLGFEFCGRYVQKRGWPYQGRATMWLSPDRYTLAVVGGGKILSIPFKKTFLYSLPKKGLVLVTTDSPGPGDISATQAPDFLVNSDLKELYAYHCRRLEQWNDNFERFEPSDVLSGYEAIYRRQADVLVDYGYAKWLGSGRNWYRFTLKGSLLAGGASRAQLKKMNEQRDRVCKRSPGETLASFGSTGLFRKVTDFLMPPDDAVADAGVAPGNVVLSFGCAFGSYALAAAEVVGPEGKVYALDIQPFALEMVNKRAAKRGFKNIETIKSDCATGLKDESVDVATMYEVYHALGYAGPAALKEIHRVLKKDGTFSYSNLHAKDADEAISLVTDGGLSRLVKKGGDIHNFEKICG